MNFNHFSVLLNETIDCLNVSPDGTYVDGTLGGGGHSLEICKKIGQAGMLIGIDRDKNAIAKAKTVLDGYSEATFINDNFFNIKNILDELGINEINGAVLDLGVSSHQLDEASRGFSYMHDAPLDMRMDIRDKFSAYDVVNDYSEADLHRIIRDYGEERWAKRITEFIVENRKSTPLQTTYDLVSVIKQAIPKKARIDGPHPAKRTFQAIRIEVNNELGILKQAAIDFVDKLAPKGRLCIITFHSLEDRIVKQAFKNLQNPCTCPVDFPICACGKVSAGQVITRKPILPSEQELSENHRSRSAKLRVFEKRS